MGVGTSNKELDTEKLKEDWMNTKWRPMMGWMYMLVCIFDFILFPILWSIVQSVDPEGSVASAWNPLTLQGAGLFHMAMGAVLGIAAFGRTQEKLASTNSYNIQSRPYNQIAPYPNSTPPINYSSSGKPKPPEQVDQVL
mgnify:CR=1 FL=1